MGLYAKLLEIQKCVRALSQDSQGNNYRYVSGSKILGTIRPKMDELGLLLKPEVLSIANVRQDYTVGRDQRPKSEVLSTVTMRFTWIDTESGERDECLWAANGQNDWDKGVGSAMTYGERYFLMKYFHLATDEDDVDNPNKGTSRDPQKPVLDASMLTPALFDQIIAAKQEAKQAGARFSILAFLEKSYIVDPKMIKQINEKVTEYYNFINTY